MPATIIDSLVVTLGLDPKQFTQGQKTAAAAIVKTRKEAEDAGKSIESSGKQAAQFFTKLRNEALTFFAVFTAGVGLKTFIGDTIGSAASLGRMSANLSMSTRELAAWQKAAERAGGSAGGITAQLQESQSEAAKYASGLPVATLGAFAKYGGDFSSLKDGKSYLLERARLVAQQYKKNAGLGALAAQELGISQENFDLIKQGPAAILALVQAQEKNAVVTEKEAAEAQRLQNLLLDLRDSLQATATRVLFALEPALRAMLVQLNRLADWVLEHKDEIAEWASTAVSRLLEFGKQVDDIVEKMGGWKVAIGALIALNLLPTISSLLALAAAITGVGTALGGATAASTAAAASGGLWAVLKRLGVGAALLTHTDELGADEMEKLKRNRAIGDQGPVFTGTREPYKTPSQLQNEVMDKLQGMGWTREQASGIAANLAQESNFNVGAVGDGGAAYGIAQWHGDRQSAFRAKYGKDIRGSTLDEQLAFLDHELRNGNERAAGDRLKGATNAAQAGAIVSKYYERPGDEIGEMSRRARMAAQIEQQELAQRAAYAAANPDVARGALAGGGRVSTNTSSSEVNIGRIEVVTQATDAQGIARDIAPAVRRTNMVSQINTGLQ